PPHPAAIAATPAPCRARTPLPKSRYAKRETRRWRRPETRLDRALPQKARPGEPPKRRGPKVPQSERASLHEISGRKPVVLPSPAAKRPYDAAAPPRRNRAAGRRNHDPYESMQEVCHSRGAAGKVMGSVHELDAGLGGFRAPGRRRRVR